MIVVTVINSLRPAQSVLPLMTSVVMGNKVWAVIASRWYCVPPDSQYEWGLATRQTWMSGAKGVDT